MLNGVPLLGGKVAWVFGSIFHVFSHPIYFIYRQDLGFIENDFLDVIRARRFTNDTTTINLDPNATNVMMWYEVEWEGQTGWIHERHYNGTVIAEQAHVGIAINERIIMVQSPPNNQNHNPRDNPNNVTGINNIVEVWGNGWPDTPSGNVLSSGSGSGTFGGASISAPESDCENGTAPIIPTIQRGLVDGAIVTLVGTASTRIRRAGHANLILRRRHTWIQVNNWRAGRWVAREVVAGYDAMDRRALAQEILNRHHGNSETGRTLTLVRVLSQMNLNNRLSAYANIEDTANGEMAATRRFFEQNPNNPNPTTGTPAPNVLLSEDLLRAILRMNDKFGAFQINTIAGGNHHGGIQDEHVHGMAVDFQSSNHIINVINETPKAVLDYLEETWRFRTQRSSGYTCDVWVASGPRANGTYYVGNNVHFHLSIFKGRF